MSSAIERFRNRKNPAVILEVSWPAESPEHFMFRVNSFAEAERTAARFATEKNLADRGISRGDEDYNNQFMTSYCYSLAPYVMRHVSSWEHVGAAEPIKFTTVERDALLEAMDFVERVGLGAAYLVALGAENQKNEPGPTTGTAS